MNLERVKAIYAEIEQYEIPLASDPRSLGPLYLQNTIAKCRNCLNAVGRIQLEVHREKQDTSRRLRAAEVDHEVAFSEVLANDERVRRLPSIEDRKATANVILRESLNRISALKAELADLEYVEKAVRYRHKELSSTMTEIKLQRSLIRDEIDSGAMYGDERAFPHERTPSPNVGGPLGDGIDEDELAAMLDESASTLATPDVPEDVPEDVSPTPLAGEHAPEPEDVAAVVSEPATERAEALLQAPAGKVVHGALAVAIRAEARAIDAAPESGDHAKVRDFLGGSSAQAETDDFDDVFENL